MGRPGKVVWSEGMALDPHHFQQWDRYHGALLQARLRSISPYAWGLTELQVDEEAIVNGSFRLTRCSGVTSDGLAFSIPDTDPRPRSRSVAEHFPPKEDRLAVFVAVPAERVDGINVLLPNDTTQRECRFVALPIAVVDETTGQEPRSIEVAHPNISLRFGDEALESYSTLKVAEVTRTRAGEFALDEKFVPPCLSIGASRALHAITRRILELLVTKSMSLWTRTRNLPRGQTALSAGDVVSLWLQQTVNAFIPIFAHYHAAARQHPEAIYTTLAMLAGQLSALPAHSSAHPRTLPAYDHENATPCFVALDTMISLLLAGEIEVNYVTIPLVHRDDLFVGEIADAALLDNATFYLIGSGVAAGAERTVPDQIRIAAPTSMKGVLSGFLRALPVEWEPRPPTGTPSDPELQYFRLGRDGRFWNEIKSSRSVAIHVPPHLNGFSVQLIAVRQGV